MKNTEKSMTAPSGAVTDSFFFRIFKYIAWLTFEDLTQAGKRRDPYRFCFACLEDRHIRRRDPDLLRKISEFHLAFREHNVDVENDLSHISLLYRQIVLVFYGGCLCDEMRQNGCCDGECESEKDDE